MSKRILYLSGSGGTHDAIFLRKLKALEPNWTTLFVTTIDYQEPMGKDIGVNTLLLNPNHLPYDDWDRKWEGKESYSLWKRIKMKYRFRTHRRRYREILRSYRPHIVHSGWLQTESYLAALEKDCPLVVMEWGTDILIRPLDNWRNYRKTRFVLSKADLLVSDSQNCLEKECEILGHRHTRSLVIPWGIDRSLFNPGKRSFELHKPLRIVLVKNLAPVSRLETMIEAVAIMEKTSSIPFEFNIYGDGVLKETLERSVTSRGLGSRIHFHGRVPQKDLPSILRESDVYLSCNESEGTSVAMMEAMACGVVPIVTGLPSYREWVTHEKNGYLYDVGDAATLATLLLDVGKIELSDLNRIRKLNFEIVAQHFDWDRNFDRLVKKYEELASLSPLTKG